MLPAEEDEGAWCGLSVEEGWTGYWVKILFERFDVEPLTRLKSIMFIQFIGR